MAVKIPTTQELVDAAITIFENKLNQTVPAVAKSFIKVLSAVLAMSHTSLYRYGVERVLQNLALTATGVDLEIIGRNYGVIRKPAEAAVLEVEGTGTNGVIVPVNQVWVSDTNTLRYRVNSSETVAGGIVTLEITCTEPGADGNMSVGETLTIDTPIAGLSSTATVTAVINTGLDQEEQEVYRRRVLNEIRTVGGGGNGVDYRTWAEETPGCARAFPYAGAPLDLGLTPIPGDISVFVEATTDIDPDGIAPQSLLDEVRDNINIDPETGKTRPPLGDFDSSLWVESIARTTFYTEVVGLSVDAAIEAQVKADIDQALLEYYALITPFLEGVDPIVTKNDIINSLNLGEVVRGILQPVGGTATGVNFGLSPGVFTETTYTLGQGELAKSGGVTYA